MTHEELRELAGAYTIDALPEEERRAVEAHLAGCSACVAEIGSYAAVVELLARDVAPQVPPAALRERILKQVPRSQDTKGAGPHQVRPPRSVVPAWFLAAAAAAFVAVGLYAVALNSRMADLQRDYRDAIVRAEAAAADAERWRLRAAAVPRTTDVLASSDVVKIDLAGQPPASGARARAFWSRSRGLVFAAAGLPPPVSGKVYQVWMVTRDGAISAGLLVVDGQGSYSLLARTDPEVAPPVAIAVTLEPAGGVPSPTGPKYLEGAP